MLDNLAIPRITPYWDPRLRGERATRIKFFRRLVDLGLGTFRTGIRGSIGLFFVRKKNGDQRMVVDARVANAMHRRPPVTELSTPGALSYLDLSGDGAD